MSDIDLTKQVCPVGISDCDWLQQLQQLQRDVEKLKALVTTDPLTGLYNYRHFEEMLRSEMQRTNRTGYPTALIMIDLDHFKKINDQWGHEGGNKALQLAASVFRQELRPFDIICRYGGEEFVVILPNTELPMAVKVADRVRVALEQSKVIFGDDEFSITASLGVSHYHSMNEHTMESLVESADQFLYQAKQNGRNQVCHADFSTLQPHTEVSVEEKAALYGAFDNKEGE